MEPVPQVAPSIVSFVHQTRKSATPLLSENVEKLSNTQLALALKVIKNTDRMWETYQEGENPKLEKELEKIVMVLAGAAEGGQKNGFSLQTFLMSREKRTEAREKQIAKLINTIQTTDLQLNQSHTIEEKSTSELIQDLEGSILKTDDQLTRQLFRDYSAIIGRVKINRELVDMTLPEELPGSWKDLIPHDLTVFIGDDPSMAKKVALLMTQGIAAEPLIKGMEVIYDPIMPDAQFHSVNTYPNFEFSKVNNELVLKVKSKGFLGVMDEGGTRKLALRYYDMTQVINLTNPDALVKMTIAPRE